MDEGWTRLVFDNYQIPYTSLSNEDFRQNRLNVDTIILAADSEATIMNGFNAERYPVEFAGGIGEAGAENLRKFVENGGKLVCFDDSCALVIKRFGLPIKNVVAGVRRNEFYNPGSVVKLQVDTKHPLAKGLWEETPAYFSTSSAFEFARVTPSGVQTAEEGTPKGVTLTLVATYAQKDSLMSGWMLGEQFVNGKTALAEATYGKGKIVLFAFRPQHRGQSYATFPFIFNALEKN